MSLETDFEWVFVIITSWLDCVYWDTRFWKYRPNWLNDVVMTVVWHQDSLVLMLHMVSKGLLPTIRIHPYHLHAKIFDLNLIKGQILVLILRNCRSKNVSRCIFNQFIVLVVQITENKNFIWQPWSNSKSCKIRLEEKRFWELRFWMRIRCFLAFFWQINEFKLFASNIFGKWVMIKFKLCFFIRLSLVNKMFCINLQTMDSAILIWKQQINLMYLTFNFALFLKFR